MPSNFQFRMQLKSYKIVQNYFLGTKNRAKIFKKKVERKNREKKNKKLRKNQRKKSRKNKGKNQKKLEKKSTKNINQIANKVKNNLKMVKNEPKSNFAENYKVVTSKFLYLKNRSHFR